MWITHHRETAEATQVSVLESHGGIQAAMLSQNDVFRIAVIF